MLDVAEGIAGGAAGRAAPITAIIGTAGDRPDDTLRGIGRIAAERAQRVAIKQTLKYLRGRTAESVVGELLVGVVAGGGVGRRRPDLRLRDRGAAGRAQRRGRAGADGGRPDAPRVIVLMCHEERDGGVRAARRARARGRSTSRPSSPSSCRGCRGGRAAADRRATAARPALIACSRSVGDTRWTSAVVAIRLTPDRLRHRIASVDSSEPSRHRRRVPHRALCRRRHGVLSGSIRRIIPADRSGR